MSVVQYPRRPGPGNSTTMRMKYTVNSCFPSRKPRPNSMKGHKTLKRDIKETMQHATLINIVAAVNEDVHCRSVPRKGSGSTINSLRSTVSVISNLMTPHEKSVSIPQSKQRIFNMPDETVQRKPVYYKHSGDLEVRMHPHVELLNESESYNFKVKKNEIVQKPKRSAREIIQSLPKKPQIMNINLLASSFKNKKSDRNHNNTAHECEPCTTSGMRQLGTVKKTERRQLHELPKCDAVDLLEAHVDRDREKSLIHDSSKILPPYTPAKIPYNRTKSLPVIFPTKSGNRISLSSPDYQKKPTVYRDRPLSQSLRKQAPESMYKRINNLPSGFGFEELSINNGINESPDISGKLVHDSEKQLHVRILSSGNPKQNVYRNIRSPVSPAVDRRSSSVFITLQNEFPVHYPRSSKTKTYRSKNALHEVVQRAMSGRGARNEYENSKLENRPVTSAKSKKSCLTSKSALSDHFSEARTPKRVQFLSSESSVNSSDVNSEKEEQSCHTPVRGGSGIIQTQTPTSTLRAFSPGIQPMSIRELLRLEQKILPANTQPPPPDILANYYTTNSLINVQTLHRSNSDMSSKIDASSDDGNSYIDELDNKPEITTLNDKFLCNDIESECKNENDCIVDTVDNNDNTEDGNYDDTDKIGFYKLVKAVDRQPYDGYEHKKIRRSSVSSKSKDQEKDHQKAHYVKVRLG